jgi:epoxyqueuosine reductase QueG
MTAAELTLVGEELGLDAVGASPAEPYEATERHIRDRRERGLFADMGFTTRGRKSPAIRRPSFRAREP